MNILIERQCDKKNLDIRDWNVDVRLDRQCERELEYVQNLLVEANAYPIPLKREIQVYESNGVSFRVRETHRCRGAHSVFISDASDKVAFVFEAEKFRIVRVCIRPGGDELWQWPQGTAGSHKNLGKTQGKNSHRQNSYLLGIRFKKCLPFFEKGIQEEGYPRDIT